VVHLEEKREDIIKFYNMGMSINKLAKHFKCSSPTMSKHLAAWGVREIQRVNNMIKECEETEK